MNLSQARLQTFRRLFGSAGYRRLFAAGAVSQLGDWLTYIAVSAVAFTAGGGALGLAIVLAAHMLPHAVLAPIAGPIVDRFDRRTILVVADVARAAIALAMAVAAAFGAVVVLEILLVVRVGVSAFANPASSAALPRLVDEEDLGEANALASLSWSVLYTLGVAAGGLVAALVGTTEAIVLDAFTFAVAAVIHAGLPSLRPDHTDDASLRSSSPEASVDDGRSFLAGLAALRGRPDLTRAVAGKAPLSMASGAGWVVLNALALDSTAAPVSDDAGIVLQGAVLLGVLQAARGVGTGLGPLVGRSLSSHLPLWNLGTFAAILWFSAVTSTWAMLVLAFVWGAGAGRNWVATTTSLQTLAADRVRGRLSSADWFLHAGAMTTGALLAAVVLDVGGSPVHAALAGAVVGVGMWAVLWRLTSKPRAQLRAMVTTEEPVRVVALR